MDIHSPSWQERFGLTTCATSAISETIPAGAFGVAVIYARTAAGDQILLVIESRTGGLREQCIRRFETAAKLPPVAELTVSFKAELLANPSPESVSEACREQVIFAGELRRELRPAMR